MLNPTLALTCLACLAFGAGAGFIARPVVAPVVCEVAQPPSADDGFFRMERQPEYGNRRY